jgi:hypothetical protein
MLALQKHTNLHVIQLLEIGSWKLKGFTYLFVEFQLVSIEGSLVLL